jgi:hypothetical protein
MAGNVRIELNKDGVAKLLKSPEVQADLKRRGEAIAAAAGDGFEAESAVGATRARVVVRTATPAAMEREAIDRTLIRSLDAGRA